MASAEETTQQALDQLRLSIDGSDSNSNGVSVNGVNGNAAYSPSPRSSGEHVGLDKTALLQKELDRVRQEKDNLSTQYQNLVSRLNNMRTTLGNKLKQDAEELDRREQLIQQLTAQNEDLTASIETLQSEIVTSNAEAERASKELEVMRSRAYEDTSQEALVRERELRELQVELERCRMERDEWEREALEGRVGLDEARSAVENYRRDLEIEMEKGERTRLDLEAEREKTMNLQSVLEDFQNAKDHELRQAVKDRDAQLTQVTQSLAEYKHRAHIAELQLEENSTNTSRTADLEKEVKEKNLLIGKLRHEAVILNEHLTEALRRLRKNQTDNNVDRRLVTNVLLSFLTTPRADSKRFEMLGLLATILSWGDSEREKAGLQRTSGSSASNSASRSRSSISGGKGTAELDTTDETESFSQRWVEFLLRESSTTDGIPPVDGASSSSTYTSPSTSLAPSRSNLSITSLPSSPQLGTTSSPSHAPRMLRLASMSSAGSVSGSSLASLSSSATAPAQHSSHHPS